jgi:hypothetical protein
VNDDLESVWNEAAVSYFKVLFWHLTGGTEENHEKNSVGIADLRADIWNRDFPNTNQES